MLFLDSGFGVHTSPSLYFWWTLIVSFSFPLDDVEDQLLRTSLSLFLGGWGVFHSSWKSLLCSLFIPHNCFLHIGSHILLPKSSFTLHPNPTPICLDVTLGSMTTFFQYPQTRTNPLDLFVTIYRITVTELRLTALLRPRYLKYKFLTTTSVLF